MDHSTLMLSLPASEGYLHVGTCFAEQSALAFGLDPSQALALKLAAEEIFCHVTRSIHPDALLEMRAGLGSWYGRLDFLFPAEGIDLKAFNLTAALSLDDPESLNEMGLFLAARFVDRFEFDREPDRRLHLTVYKEKSYDRFEKTAAREGVASAPWVLRPPDWDETIILAQEIVNHIPDQLYPEFFKYPAKVADMVKSDECRAVVAFGQNGLPAGGIAWRWLGLRTVEFFGPYLFGSPAGPDLKDRLIETCINALARTSCLSLICRYTPDDLTRHQFQELAGLYYRHEDGSRKKRQAFFRLMHEDMGSLVWIHPALEDDLRKEYQRLALPRETETPVEQELSGHSVISSYMDLSQKEATLKPILPGVDIKENLNGHLCLFEKEDLETVYFIIDLGRARQSVFVPYLLDAGFTPRMVLPYAGRGDQLVFQFRTDHR